MLREVIHISVESHKLSKGRERDVGLDEVPKLAHVVSWKDIADARRSPAHKSSRTFDQS